MSRVQRPKSHEHPRTGQHISGSMRKPALPARVHVFEANADVTCAADHNVMLEIWRVRPTVELFARLDEYFRWLVERHPRIGALSVIDSPATPDAPTREAGAALISRYAQNLIGLAFVIEGSSFKHSMIRFSLTTIDLLSSSTVPQPVFDNVDAACRWLSDRLPEVGARERGQIVAALRDPPAP